MKDRLKEFLDKKKINARQFADEIGVQPSSISHILTGRNKASVELLEKMIRVFPDLDVQYLISGIGSVSVHSSVPDMENTDDSTGKQALHKPEIEEDSSDPDIEKIMVFYSTRLI